MIQSFIRILLFLCGSFYSTIVCSQNDSNSVGKPSLFDLIESQEELAVEIYGAVDSLMLNKMKPYEGNCLATFMGEGLKICLPVTISVRGKFRRRTCDFPPLLLNFENGPLKDAGLSKADKYKLVTHCLETDTENKYLFKEYLIYKFYEELNPASFRTKLFPIRYVDVLNKVETSRYAFLLESNEELGERLGGDWCDCMGLTEDSIDVFAKELIIFFQYMVGNKDMNMHIEHNVRFLEKTTDSIKYPVPYDFDFAAFVNTPYAFPSYTTTVSREDLIRGTDEKVFSEVHKLFLSKEERLLEIIDAFPLLSARDKRMCKSFMESFYKRIKRNDFISSYLNN